MKKTKLIAIALCAVLIVVGAIIIIAGAGPKPELNLKTAQENLEYYDYKVNVEHYGTSRDDMDAVMFDCTLTAYNDYDDYIEIFVFEDASMAKAYYNKLKKEYEIDINGIKSQIELVEKSLKVYGDNLSKDLLEETEEELKELKDELKEESNYVIGRSGKYVWVGTKKAIENSKKNK